MRWFSIASILLFLFSFGMPASANEQDLFDSLTDYWQQADMLYSAETNLSWRSHLLQAAHIARMAGAPEDIIIGLLLDNISSLPASEGKMSNIDIDRQDAAWAERHGFSKTVVNWLSFKTLSKIVLCDQEKGYCSHIPKGVNLSFSDERKYFSNMGFDEVGQLLGSANLEVYLSARRCIDMAVLAGFYSVEEDPQSLLPSFSSYRQMFVRVNQGKGRPARNPRWMEAVRLLQESFWEDPEAFLAETKRYTSKHFYLS